MTESSSRSYAILGTGALGGYYGGLIARAGFATHFLLRSDFEYVRQHGLRVDSKRGDFHLSPEAVHIYDDPSELPACDVAVICLKTTQNHQLPELLARCVKPDGVVLVLQNGLHPEADAAKVVGDERVLGGLCFLCSNKVGPGHIKHLDYGHIHMGVYQPEAADSPAARHLPVIVADFNAAGIETTGVDDLRLSRWKKLVWNIPYNGLSVVLNQTTNEMMGDAATRRRIEAIMHEVKDAAFAVDRKVINDAFIQKMLDDTVKMKPYKTSMMLDHEAGREMEVESIVGDPLRAAHDAGTDPRWIYTTYAQLGIPDGRADRYPRVDKACAAVVRQTKHDPELLVFTDDTHTQLPKGGLDADEPPEAAAIRELKEETGVAVAQTAQVLSPLEMVTECGDEQRDRPVTEYHFWHVYLFEAPDSLPDRWEHTVTGQGEDHGNTVSCGWLPLYGDWPEDFDARVWPILQELRSIFPAIDN